MTRPLFFSCAFALVSLTAACAADDPAESKPSFEEARSSVQRDGSASLDAADATTFRDGNTAFALDLHRRVAATNKNLALSPYSISTALAMTYGGARGETESEMARALHFDLGQDKTHVGMNVLARELEARAGEGKAIDGSPLRLDVENALFLQKGFSFETTYLDMIARQYGAGLKLADFATRADSERVKINRWVSTNTNDKIPELFGPGSIMTATKLVLVNAVYMNAAWAHPFVEGNTQPGSFTDEAGATSSVSMMAENFTTGYASTDAADAVTLRYSGGKLSFTAVLPRTTLADLEAKLDAKMLEAIFAAREDARVSVRMPRFKIDGDAISLVPQLKAMGMKQAFESGQADLSGMSSEKLFVGNVVHKAFLDVTEKGTEAAAATGVLVLKSSDEQPDKKIVFDRPFFVAIRDEVTGAFLFTARIAKP